MSNNIVQYVLVRGDLKSALNWPFGAVIAQCCHATTAVLHLYADDPDTIKYYHDLDNMHKVILEVKDESHLRSMDEKLASSNLKYKMWIEQPENIPTCIAIKPYPKNCVHKFVKHLKLMK